MPTGFRDRVGVNYLVHLQGFQNLVGVDHKQSNTMIFSQFFLSCTLPNFTRGSTFIFSLRWLFDIIFRPLKQD
jgi:hypothetical protein